MVDILDQNIGRRRFHTPASHVLGHDTDGVHAGALAHLDILRSVADEAAIFRTGIQQSQGLRDSFGVRLPMNDIFVTDDGPE